MNRRKFIATAAGVLVPTTMGMGAIPTKTRLKPEHKVGVYEYFTKNTNKEHIYEYIERFTYNIKWINPLADEMLKNDHNGILRIDIQIDGEIAKRWWKNIRNQWVSFDTNQVEPVRIDIPSIDYSQDMKRFVIVKFNKGGMGFYECAETTKAIAIKAIKRYPGAVSVVVQNKEFNNYITPILQWLKTDSSWVDANNRFKPVEF